MSLSRRKDGDNGSKKMKHEIRIMLLKDDRIRLIKLVVHQKVEVFKSETAVADSDAVNSVSTKSFSMSTSVIGHPRLQNSTTLSSSPFSVSYLR